MFSATGTSLYAQKAEWEAYYPADSSYLISLPKGTLSEQIDTFYTEIGAIIYRKAMNFTRMKRNEIYTVISDTEYPLGTVHSDSTELLNEFWQATIEESVDNLSGELLYKTEKRVGEWPAILWRVNYGDNMRMDNLAILKRNHFYLLQFSSPDAIEFTKMKEQFFASLYLINTN